MTNLGMLTIGETLDIQHYEKTLESARTMTYPFQHTPCGHIAGGQAEVEPLTYPNHHQCC